MAIAGVQQAAINSLGADTDHAGISRSHNLAIVTPIQGTNGQSLGDAEQAGNTFRLVNTRFEFSIHEATQEIMVKVIDEDTNETIREIPPEQVLDMLAKMWEVAGIMVDETV